jgi:molecular chaperone HtpG
MLSQEDFYERAKDFALLKDIDGKYFTYEEYRTLIKDQQTDKEGNLIYLYANDPEAEYSFIEGAKKKGYSVLLMDGQLDTPMVGMLEQKLEKCRFTRVDADIIERLIVKEDAPKNTLSKEDSDNLAEIFKSQMPKSEKANFYVEVQNLGEEAQPLIITQSEYMRRMKDMSRYQQGMGFYAQMPDAYNLVLNSDHPLVKKVLSEQTEKTGKALEPILAEIKGQEARLAILRQEQDKKKPEEITQEEKDDLANTQKAIDDQQQKKQQVIADSAKDNQIVHQLIDLALLQNGMLRGEALDKFLRRSVELIG